MGFFPCSCKATSIKNNSISIGTKNIRIMQNLKIERLISQLNFCSNSINTLFANNVIECKRKQKKPVSDIKLIDR